MRHLPLIFCLFLALPASAAAKRIVILGDSLTEGYGIPKDKAFPALLEKQLRAKGHPVEVVNAGISGSTSASGPRRLEWQLRTPPAVLVLALGANDGLRGLEVENTRENLSKVIRAARARGVKVLLTGMKMPPNYGQAYRRSFEEMYVRLAEEHGIPRMPFLLEGVAGKASMNLADGIHPNEAGHEKIAEMLLPFVLRLL